MGPLVKSVNTKQLKSLIDYRNRVKRTTFVALLEIGPNLKIEVKGYTLYNRLTKTKKCYAYAMGDDIKIVHAKMKPFSAITGKEVDEKDIKRTFSVGAEFVPFSQEQMEKIKELEIETPIIRIVGFKKLKNVLKPGYNTKSSPLIYPIDTNYQGSTKAFSCLHQALIQKGKVAIACGVLRKNSTPVMYALVPSSSTVDTNESSSDQYSSSPNGLFMIRLPFIDDIRATPESFVVAEASEESIDAARAVVSKLIFKNGYSPQKYPNPGIDYFYQNLQAIAIDEPLITQIKDRSYPKYNNIRKHAGTLLEKWNEEISNDLNAKGSLFQDVLPKKTAKPKSDKQIGRPELTTELAIEAIENNSLSKYTVKQLIQWMESIDLKYRSKLKKDLIDTIERHFSE